MKLQFAQNTALPKDSVIHKGSYITIDYEELYKNYLAWLYHYVCEENEFP